MVGVSGGVDETGAREEDILKEALSGTAGQEGVVEALELVVSGTVFGIVMVGIDLGDGD